MVDQLVVVRRRGHARRARGRHRGHPRRPGRGQGRLRHVARPDRERELPGRQPDRPGAQHRPGHDRGRAAATCRRRSPSTPRARSSSSRTRSTRWSTSSRSFADEVTRVAREVGTEGKLGGQAEVEGVSGTWRDLTENVNLMATNLTDQVRNIAQVTTAVANGDLTQKITVDARGEIARAQGHDQHDGRPAARVRRPRSRASRARSAPRASSAARPRSRACRGTWRGLTENVNLMATNLTDQVRNIASVTTAVAHGDLTRKITVDAQGEILELKDTINTMVDQLSSLRRRGHARRARGRHRGQARRPGRGQGRLRHVARPDRERQPARRQPHRARCATSPRSRPRWPTAT